MQFIFVVYFDQWQRLDFYNQNSGSGSVLTTQESDETKIKNHIYLCVLYLVLMKNNRE